MCDTDVLRKTMRDLIKLKHIMVWEGITPDIKDKYSTILLGVCDISNSIWTHLEEIEMSERPDNR